MVRDTLIRLMAPHIVKGFNLTRPQALELLARLTPEARDTFYGIRGMALGFRNRKTP